MKIYHGLEAFRRLDYAVVTSGTFDGVHKGHQKILNRVNEIARANNGESVLITYWPHPRIVLQKDSSNLKLLSTFEEKASILSRQGIDHLIRIPFTHEFADLSSQTFIQDILVDKIGTRKLVIGYDHRFGKNREGSFEHLIVHSAKYGFQVEEISRQDVDKIGVSSTKIRSALDSGHIEMANEFLGRPYEVTAKVVEGDKVGRSIGFPTANLFVEDEYKLIPSDGVYAVKIAIENQIYEGMLNIGFRPTLNGRDRSIEVHIFGFDGQLYGQELVVQFFKFIRSEIQFANLEELKYQLEQDKAMVLSVFK
jgi:riboflavin kinase / FMN adenylyltransferase